MTALRILATDQPTAVERRGPILPMSSADKAFWAWREKSKPKCEGYGKR